MNKNFDKEREQNIKNLTKDNALQILSKKWIINSSDHKYSYNFTWLGRPIIQFPQDIIAIQEIIWSIKPDLIIETGIAHGGGLILYASILELIGKGKVIGIDIDIREHNRKEIEKHPLSKRIKMIEGSSIDEETIRQVSRLTRNKKTILIILDSNHTKDHVLAELNRYSAFVTKGSYLIVFDTIINDLPDRFFYSRPWNRSNNPKLAVHEFLKNNDRFMIDKKLENKLMITVAPDGYLKCIKK